ncbi:MAG: hypothetical protein SVN78_08665 [Deferribacterota bacterium]|nr:hypothetical protein [Deferribacterota bacterium]
MSELMQLKLGGKIVKEKNFEQLFKIIDYLLDNNLDKCLEFYKNLVLQGDSKIEDYIVLGKLCRKKGDYKRSIKLFETVLADARLKGWLRGYVKRELLRSYYSYGDYEKVIDISNDIKRKDEDIYKILADAYSNTLNFKRAVSAYKKLEKISGRSFKREVAYSYFTVSNKYDETSKEYIRLIKKGLKYYERSRRGNMALIKHYYKRGEKKHTISLIDEFVEKELMKSDNDLIELEKIYYEFGDIEDYASKILYRYRLNEKNIFFVLYLINFYNKMNKSEKALTLLKQTAEEYGVKRLIARKYLEFEPNIITKEILDDNNYKCLKCDNLFNEYSDICPICNHIETMRPY